MHLSETISVFETILVKLSTVDSELFETIASDANVIVNIVERTIIIINSKVEYNNNFFIIKDSP